MPHPISTPPMTGPDWTLRVVNVVKVDDNGCWNWPKFLAPNGYGNIHLNGGRHYIHRVAYTTIKGTIPEGLQIDHLCRNRACCNPDHLEAVTQRVNNLRSESFAATRARQTECVNGHEFNTANTYIAPNGTRKCRTCRKRVNNASYHRTKVSA